MANKQHQDQRIIKGIVKGDSKILQEIYSRYIKSSMDFVRKNGGTIQDAEDVVQEGLVVIFKKARRGELQLTSSFSTYLFSVCRFIWWKAAKKKGNNTVTIGEDWGLIDKSNIVVAVEKRERHQFFLSKLQELSASCRQILQLHIDSKKISYITKVMGFKTEGYTRKHKSRCKKQLLNRAKTDPQYAEYI